MSAPLLEVPKRLAVLFLIALLGVLVMLGLVVGRLGGWPAGTAYAVAVAVAVLLGIRAAKRRRRAAARAAGRTCRCCTTSVHDPVQVI